LINRKFAIGLHNLGYNVKIACFNNRLPEEIPQTEKEILKEIGLEKGYHPDIKNAIRLYCFLPIDRVMPSLYNISFTMMETNTVQPKLINTLNSNYNESWFPCFVENTIISTDKNNKHKIQEILEKHKALTHLGQIERISNKQKRLYTGNLYTISTYMMKNQLVGTQEHPIYVRYRKNNFNEFVKIKELSRNFYLIYPKEINNNNFVTVDIIEVLKNVVDIEFLYKEKRGKIQIFKEEMVYNHILDKYVPVILPLYGNDTIKTKLKIDKNFSELLGIFLNSNYKIHNQESFNNKQCQFTFSTLEKAEKFSFLIKNVFGNKINVQIEPVLMRIHYCFIAKINNDVLILVLSLAKEFYQYFNQINKIFFLNGALFYFGEFKHNKFIAKLNETYIYVKFLLDCGIVPTFDGTLCENKYF
jgi:hypothetical protein